MADIDAVDEIVAFCQRKGVDPRPFLALAWHESAGLSRSLTGQNPDGSTWRAFPGGDFGARGHFGWGPRSFGACQIYAVIHGPFLPDGTPDYAVANRQWDDVTRSCEYLWTEAPAGGWGATYRKRGGDTAFLADPVGFLLGWVPLAQGSIPWQLHHARNAAAMAEQLYQGWVARHAAPPPEPDPEPPVVAPPSDLEARLVALQRTDEALAALIQESNALPAQVQEDLIALKGEVFALRRILHEHFAGLGQRLGA